MTAARRAPRRSTEKVRQLILDTATDLFAEHGYAQTSMRDIATRADMSLSVLYRQFSNKDELYAATLLAPFLVSFEDFATAWGSQVDSPWDDEELLGEFVRDLYSSLADNRKLLVTLLSSGDEGSDLLERARDSLTSSMTDLRLMAEHEAGRRPWLTRDHIAVSNSLMVALVTGLVLLKPLLDRTPTGDPTTMVAAAARLARYGMSLGPDPAADESQ